jgi:hypothetical protein
MRNAPALHVDQLYQVLVTYERSRVEGLTDADLIESLSTVYGAPLLRSSTGARAASSGIDIPSDTVMVARWDLRIVNPEGSAR